MKQDLIDEVGKWFEEIVDQIEGYPSKTMLISGLDEEWDVLGDRLMKIVNSYYQGYMPNTALLDTLKGNFFSLSKS